MSESKFEILKRDDSQRLIFGFASVVAKVNGELVVDSQGDMIEVDTIEKSAYRYVIDSREGRVMHGKRPVATLVESCVLTKAKMALMGIPDGSIPEGWWVGMRVNDEEVWERVKSGELRAFSVGGSGRRENAEGIK